MLVARTADGFRATLSKLRSLDGKRGLRFHTFPLPEDRCLFLLVKTLGRQMPEEVVRVDFDAGDLCPGILASQFRAP
jgi:hypothetical protein